MWSRKSKLLYSYSDANGDIYGIKTRHGTPRVCMMSERRGVILHLFPLHACSCIVIVVKHSIGAENSLAFWAVIS